MRSCFYDKSGTWNQGDEVVFMKKVVYDAKIVSFISFYGKSRTQLRQGRSCFYEKSGTFHFINLRTVLYWVFGE